MMSGASAYDMSNPPWRGGMRGPRKSAAVVCGASLSVSERRNR
jgi:hypothetical protein